VATNAVVFVVSALIIISPIVATIFRVAMHRTVAIDVFFRVVAIVFIVVLFNTVVSNSFVVVAYITVALLSFAVFIDSRSITSFVLLAAVYGT
jgi:hypothetical protein